MLLHAASTVVLFLVLWRMTSQRAVPGTDPRLVAAQASGARVRDSGPSATTQRAVPGTDRRLVAAQASGARAATAGPSATTQRAVPTVAQASGVRAAQRARAQQTLPLAQALVAALFAVHPLHVESVAWIAERRDVLSGLFFMLTLGAYDDYVAPSAIARALSGRGRGLFALGLLAKPMLVTLPPLLLLLDYWPLGRFGGCRPALTRRAGRPAVSCGGWSWKSCRWWPWPWPRPS